MSESFSVEIRWRFRYGHRLMPPYKGKCQNLHGEAGVAIIHLSKQGLDSSGMLIDFGEVKKIIGGWIDENWDHAYIFDADDEIGPYLATKGLRTFCLVLNPTAENMAYILQKEIKEKLLKEYGFKVRVGMVESFEDSIAWCNDND